MSARTPPPPPRNRPRSALTLPAWPLRACNPGPSHRRRPREMAALPDLPRASSAFPDPSSSPTPRPTRFRPLGPPKLAPGNGPGAAGEAAPGGGEEPWEGGRGAPGTMQWRPGRGRVRGMRLPKVSPGSSSLPPGTGTRSEEGRRCGGGDWRWGSERLLCWGAVSSSRKKMALGASPSSPTPSPPHFAVSSAFRRLPRPLRPTCLPPPKALSAPGFWRLPGVARPPSSVLLLITLVLYRIRVPFSPSLFSPLVF